MINFRFHLISLVAVFLALGVGVAMGASFVDRATVDSLRGRVDDLDRGFRDRGQQIEDLEGQLRQSDEQAAALGDGGSYALDARLDGQRTVLIVPEGTPDGVLDVARGALTAAGSPPAALVRLRADLGLEDEGVVRRVRERLDLRTGTVPDLRERVVDLLGVALGRLAAPTNLSSAATTTTPPPTTATPAPTVPSTEGPAGAAPSSPVTTPTDPVAARAVLSAMVDAGLITIEATGPADQAFPLGPGVRYVELAPVATGGEAVSPAAEVGVLVPLSTSLSATAPGSLTVAATLAERPPGTATTTTTPAAATSVVQALRQGDAAQRLSTVDDLQDPFGRLATVYAVAAGADGRVGHYGTGPGAEAPFPTVPTG
ncbi:MAG: copper transporter [Microthrixaceae bacterium]